MTCGDRQTSDNDVRTGLCLALGLGLKAKVFGLRLGFATRGLGLGLALPDLGLDLVPHGLVSTTDPTSSQTLFYTIGHFLKYLCQQTV